MWNLSSRTGDWPRSSVLEVCAQTIISKARWQGYQNWSLVSEEKWAVLSPDRKDPDKLLQEVSGCRCRVNGNSSCRLYEIHWGVGVQYYLCLNISQLAKSKLLAQLNLSAVLKAGSSPTAEGVHASSTEHWGADVERLVLQELTFRHLSPPWIWPSASVNHFEHETTSLNSSGLAWHNGDCMAERI